MLFPYHLMYLLLGCIHLAVALVIYAKRPDLRRAIVTAGCAGGFVEAASEVWYEKDYWHPPTVIQGWPAPEDFIYGFGVTAMTVCIVPVLAGCTYVPMHTEDARPAEKIGTVTYIITCAATFAGLMAAGSWLKDWTSIWTAVFCYFAIGVGLMAVRGRRLFRFGLLAAMVMGVVATAGYGVGLNFLIDGDDFLRQVWLPYGTEWDIRVLGNVPLDEVAWNMARAWCFAILYPVVTWKRFVVLKS